MKRALAVDADVDQHFGNAMDSSRVDSSDNMGDGSVLRGPSSHGAVQLASPSECFAHELPQKTGLAFSSIEVPNNPIG